MNIWVYMSTNIKWYLYEYMSIYEHQYEYNWLMHCTHRSTCISLWFSLHTYVGDGIKVNYMEEFVCAFGTVISRCVSQQKKKLVTEFLPACCEFYVLHIKVQYTRHSSAVYSIHCTLVCNIRFAHIYKTYGQVSSRTKGKQRKQRRSQMHLWIVRGSFIEILCAIYGFYMHIRCKAKSHHK